MKFQACSYPACKAARLLAYVLPHLLVLPLLSGCATIEYYAQAVTGHLEIMRRAVTIEESLNEPDVPASLRARLSRVLQIREFASRELGLPNNASYRRYADLGRQFAVWNVFAAPEFSVKMTESCFPIAGCVGYRGYYSEAGAEKYAAGLAREGYDVHVGGVPAYSTLGWFDDPVLSTFVQYPEAELARLLFHELAHQVVYVKNSTAFNESFAVAVEEEGLRRWLGREGTPAQRASYEAFRARRAQFIALILDYRGRLAAFYAKSGSDDEKRAGKARLFASLKEDYDALKATSWGGYAGYDRFFARGANNALLASVSTYTEFVPGFRALLAQNNNDLPAFYAAVGELARLPRAAREARLREAALAR